MKCRILSTLLALAMLFALLPLSASADIILPPDPFDDIVSGTCGDLKWELNRTSGVLTITGTGEMTDAPWLAYTGSIRTVNIGDGVTNIGSGAFQLCTRMTSVSIPDSVTVIGKNGFAGCNALKEITIPESVTTIGNGAFAGCTALTDVYFEGIEAKWNKIAIGESNECLIAAELHCEPCLHENSHSEHQNATCTEPGYDRTVCDDCGEILSEMILPALGHDLITDSGKPATCTEGGLTEGHHCSRCDYVIEPHVIPALGHDWDDGVVTLEPTENEQGEKTFTCRRCSETRTEIIPELSHVHSYTDVVTPPTCTDQGYTTHTCSCGDSYVDSYVDAPGHDWDEGKVTTAATAAKDGVKTFTCTRCGETKTETIPATGECDGGKDCPSYEFKDVRAGDWYHEAVDYAVTNKLMNGVGDDTFAPNNPMTRAMLVTVLWRYEGEPQEGKNTFSDVPADQWYTDAVAWAAAKGIVGGVGNNKFDPNGNITREQMAAILYRYADKKGFDLSKHGDLSGFPDRGRVSDWATDAMVWAVGAGLIGGANGYLLPQGNATRAQVATILMRFIENVAKS